MLKFKPRPDQVDYTNARWAPVINCVLKFKDKILVVKRGDGVGFYKGYWNGIAGFIDDKRSFLQKIKDEVKEETGVCGKNILDIKLGEIFHQEAPKYKKTWIVHPVLVEVATDEIKLDWEAENYKWINPREAEKLKLLPGFKEVLERVIKL